MADLLAGQQAPDDVNAFDEALVTNFLARPHFSGDPLVRCLARSERRPEPARKHLRKGRDGLGDDRRVVALPRRIDDAERNIRRRQGGTEERPGEARLALAFAPRAEVVRGHAGGEAGLLSLLDVLKSWAGLICSCEQWKPMTVMANGIPVLGAAYVKNLAAR